MAIQVFRAATSFLGLLGGVCRSGLCGVDQASDDAGCGRRGGHLATEPMFRAEGVYLSWFMKFALSRQGRELRIYRQWRLR